MAFRFLGRTAAAGEDLTWSGLFRAAHRQARALGDLRGKQVGLLCNRPQDFVVSLVATFLAASVAVPMPATLNRRSAEHVKAIIAAADLAAIVAPTDVLATDWLSGTSLDRTRRVSLEYLRDADDTSGFMPPPDDFDAPLIIQFTSGSTGAPQGVVLSQANVMANCSAIVRAYGLGATDVGLSWLPLHHDMGLVGHVLVPIFVGGRSVIMDPLRYLQKPLSWLQAIGRERATITSAPNFAYELCNLAAADARNLDIDLSSLATAICGGEPVLAETMQKFIRRFGEFGFRREAFAPSYGLAEATLLVSTGKRADGPAFIKVAEEAATQSRSFTDLGTPVEGFRVRIVDPVSKVERSGGLTGEIEISGPSVGRVIGHEISEWTPTGDLGFFAAGRLAVTGRLKDMLVLRGENLPPADAEAALAGMEIALVPGGAAAIGVERDGTQVMVIVAELRSRFRGSADSLVRQVREAISAATGHVPAEVIFVKSGALPRTTSGKLRRRSIADLHRNGQLSPWRETSVMDAALHA